jgi:hypothetical protein
VLGHNNAEGKTTTNCIEAKRHINVVNQWFVKFWGSMVLRF